MATAKLSPEHNPGRPVVKDRRGRRFTTCSVCNRLVFVVHVDRLGRCSNCTRKKPTPAPPPPKPAPWDRDRAQGA